MTSLFAGQALDQQLPGARLQLYTDFLAPELHQGLFERLQAELQWRQDNMRIAGRQQPLPRLQAWYGAFAYSYSGIDLQPCAWTSALLAIKQAIETLGFEFNTMLANLYRHGRDSVGWHADNERALGSAPVIASYSLGATRRFELKPVASAFARQDWTLPKTLKLDLSDNSLLIMHPPMQQFWQHQVPKQPHIQQPRINLTFRKILQP